MTKKKYRNATVKLIIGLILLSASWWYLVQHPAEKASLLSGVDVLGHRIQMRVASMQGADTQALDQQYKLSRYMQEMRYTAEHTSGCDDSALIDEIQTTINELNRLSATDAVSQSAQYWSTIREREIRIQDHCTSSSDDS